MAKTKSTSALILKAIGKVARGAAACAAALCAGSAWAADYYVGGNNASDDNDGTEAAPFATLSAAASSAAAGDTIHVAAGRYAVSSPLEIAAANVTVAGTGRDAVVIDGQGASRGIVASGANFTLRNLTVSNCVAAADAAATGAGVCLGATGWKLDNVAIVCCTNLSTTAYGGGAYLGTAGTATNCLFASNAAASGGAAYCAFSSDEHGEFRQTFQSCVFESNAAIGEANGTSGNGGVFYGHAYSGSKICYKLYDCTFSGNSAAFNGGAIHCAGANSTQGSYVEEAAGSVFVDNVARAGAGGAVCGFSAQLASNMVHRYVSCTFRGNNAARNGGGIVVQHGQIRNCLFAENVAGTDNNSSSYGGAIFMRYDGAIENCSFVGNRVGGYYKNGNDYSKGGAVSSDPDRLQYFVGMTNCLFFANSAVMGNKVSNHIQVNPWQYMNVYVLADCWGLAANCLEANNPDYPSFDLTTLSNHMENGVNGCKVGTFDAAALFANYAGGDYAPKNKDSALVDAGLALDWMADAMDIRNDPKIARIIGSAPDIGCYEFHSPERVFVMTFR